MRPLALLVIFSTACAAPREPAATSAEGRAPTPSTGPAPEVRGAMSAFCAEPRYRIPSLQGLQAREVAGGFSFVEGPVWIAEGSSLLFSDMQPSSGPEQVQPSHVRRWSAAAGVDTFLENAGSNGLALGPDGKLLACTHDRQAVSAFDLASKERKLLVESAGGKRFNSPNDLAVRSDGTIYFTDPDWQKGSRPSDTGITGVYRAAPDGRVSLVDGALDKPNGIALGPDERVLYVASGDGKLWRYPVNADGSTGKGSAFAELPVPDGMTVDCAGNLYATAHNLGQIVVYAPDGRELGRIAVAPKLTNVAFGGPDRRTLFATAGTALYAVELDIAGAPY